MNNQSYDTNDIIYALATPWGRSALAIIRVSGHGCIERMKTLFSHPASLEESASHTTHFGTIEDPETKQTLDEVMITIYKEGRGYTGEESLEITLHGNPSGISSVMSVLHKHGMRNASPGEYTFRAFVHGRIDLTQAEAVQEIISSRTKVSHSLALGRLRGNLHTLIDEIKLTLMDALSIIEVQLDYAEDEIGGDIVAPSDLLAYAKERLDTILSTYAMGKLYQEGARVVLAGSTNAGKSTLFNLLLREERSIVSDIHGTTRDFIEAKVEIEGIPLMVFDTAGIRPSQDSIEMEGIKRTEQLLESADLILLILDGSTYEEHQLLPLHKKIMTDERCIIIWNKTDLVAKEAPKGSFPISAKRGDGFEEVRREIVRRLCHSESFCKGEELVIESSRQKEELERAREAIQKALEYVVSDVPLDIIAVELGEALHALGSLTGEIASSDILERIFTQFCVGK